MDNRGLNSAEVGIVVLVAAFLLVVLVVAVGHRRRVRDRRLVDMDDRASAVTGPDRGELTVPVELPLPSAAPPAGLGRGRGVFRMPWWRIMMPESTVYADPRTYSPTMATRPHGQPYDVTKPVQVREPAKPGWPT